MGYVLTQEGFSDAISQLRKTYRIFAFGCDFAAPENLSDLCAGSEERSRTLYRR